MKLITRLFFLFVTSNAIVGCPFSRTGPPHLEGPGPSDQITTRLAAAAEVSGPMRVECTGPSDAIAALGGLCTGSPGAGWLTDAVGDMSYFIGGPDGSPKIIVLGYFDANAPSRDHAADIRYSAYLLADSNAWNGEGGYWYAALILSQWSNATPLVGEIATNLAEYR